MGNELATPGAHGRGVSNAVNDVLELAARFVHGMNGGAGAFPELDIMPDWFSQFSGPNGLGDWSRDCALVMIDNRMSSLLHRSVGVSWLRYFNVLRLLAWLSRTEITPKS